MLTVIPPGSHGRPAAAAVEVPPDYQVLAPVTVAAEVDTDLLNRRVDRAWSATGLGSHKALAIDALTGPPGVDVGRSPSSALMPASTTKLLTAAAVLRTLGPEHRFTTSVTRKGDQLFLVGGGDPQLTSLPSPRGINSNASLVRLARRTATALADEGVESVRLAYDATLFDPPAEQSFWGDDFLAIGVVAPITALSADGGRSSPPGGHRSSDPPLTAAVAFARLLTAQGIQVRGAPTAAEAAGKRIAEVSSPPLADLVEHLLLTSDNTEAEILAHHVGLAVLDDPSFTGGAKATLQVLDDLGVDTSTIVLNDGSGLSRANRISPRTLLDVLAAAMETDPDRLWPVYTGLPVAGFDGSLRSRFAAPAAWAGRGAVTGKTGTLTGTSTLAGLVADRSGQVYTYAVMTNQVSVWSASPAIDALLSRVARCRCAAAPDPAADD